MLGSGVLLFGGFLAALVLIAWQIATYLYPPPPKGTVYPPAAKHYPILGHGLDIAENSDFTCATFAKYVKEHGDTVSIIAPGCRRGALVNDAEGMKFLVSTGLNDGTLAKGPDLQRTYKEFLGSGIFTVNGEEWKKIRAEATSLFHQQHLRDYVPIFIKHAERLITRIESDGLKNIDMQDMFMRYTLDSFCEIGFGVEVNSIREKINHFAIAFDYVQTFSEGRNRFGRLNTVKEKVIYPQQFHDHIAYMDTYVKNIIDLRRDESDEELGGRPDLLSRQLLAMRKSTLPIEEQNKHLRDFVLNFLIAGRDTTATLLTWTCYTLDSHRDVEKKILDEMDSVVGDQPISLPLTKNLTYLGKVLSEVLRLYPPVPIDGYDVMRDCVVPHSGDQNTVYGLREGDFIIYSAYLLHRNPKYWPDPEKFDPNRFDKPPVKYSYAPFHLGPRICLGQEMAILEAKTMLVLLLRRYKLTHVPTHTVKMKQAILLTSSTGMLMDLEKR